MATKTISLIQKHFYSLVIEEDITRVSSDIASCGPAFFSYLLQCFINAAVDRTNITHEEATTLVSEMVVGMETTRKGIFTLPTLQEKVCERRRYRRRYSGFRRTCWRYVS